MPATPIMPSLDVVDLHRFERPAGSQAILQHVGVGAFKTVGLDYARRRPAQLAERTNAPSGRNAVVAVEIVGRNERIDLLAPPT